VAGARSRMERGASPEDDSLRTGIGEDRLKTEDGRSTGRTEFLDSTFRATPETALERSIEGRISG
jgi:hypothetical protein